MQLTRISQALSSTGVAHVIVAATTIPGFETLKPDDRGITRTPLFDLFPKYQCFIRVDRDTKGFTVQLTINKDGWGSEYYKVGVVGTELCLEPLRFDVTKAVFATQKKAYAAVTKLLRQVIKAKDLDAVSYAKAFAKAKQSMNPADLIATELLDVFRNIQKYRNTYDVPCLQYTDYRGKTYPVQLEHLNSMSRHYLGDLAAPIALELPLTKAEYSADVLLVANVFPDLSTTLVVVGSAGSDAGELSSKSMTVIKTGELPDADKINDGASLAKSINKLVHAHSKQILAARAKFDITRDESVKFV